VSRYQKVKPIWILLKQETASGSGISWTMQVCTSLQTDNHASTPPLKLLTGRMPFLPPYQQRQSTEGITAYCSLLYLPQRALMYFNYYILTIFFYPRRQPVYATMTKFTFVCMIVFVNFPNHFTFYIVYGIQRLRVASCSLNQ